MKQLPEILATKTLAKTRMFHIQQIDLRFSNGTSVQYERMCGSPRGAVLVVPMLDDETVLMIREYAVGVERYELALPKGRIERDEALTDAANRELMEETGYAARTLQHLTSMTLAPGYSNQTTHIVLAQELYEKTADGDEPEPIEVIPMKLKTLAESMIQNEITEARTIAALFMVRDLLAK